MSTDTATHGDSTYESDTCTTERPALSPSAGSLSVATDGKTGEVFPHEVE